jgi:hypothetical protein
MSITLSADDPRDYDWLKTAVSRWLHRSDLTSMIPDFIGLGEARIFREMRVQCMETQLSDTIASGVIAVPSDYVELIHARVDGSPTSPLTKKTSEWIYANYPTRSADGQPKFIAREGGSFIFGPYPDSTYSIKGLYYARLAPLSDGNTTNWLTENAPDLLLFAALCEAAPYLVKDDRVALWEAKYKNAKDAVQGEDKGEFFSGSPIAMTVR